MVILLRSLVANTFVKLGMKTDGVGVQFYVNGVPVGVRALLSNAKMPDEVNLSWYLGMTMMGTTATAIYLDWVRIAHTY
jgi:hypothetical protein